MFANPNLVSSVEGVHSCGDACIGVPLGHLKFSISEGYEDIAARLATCYKKDKFPLWQLRFPSAPGAI